MKFIFTDNSSYYAQVFVTCETSVRHVTNNRFTRDEHPTHIYVTFRKRIWSNHRSSVCIKRDTHGEISS